MHMKCLQLFKLMKTPVKMNLMCSSQEFVRSTRSFLESKIFCKNISEYLVLTYQKEMVSFGYVIFGHKIDVQVKEI